MMTRAQEITRLRRELRTIEARRKLLRSLLADYKKLAKLGPPVRDVKPKGSLSLRGSVLQVIQEAGAAIKPVEIWHRVQALGAASDAKDPIAICDLMAHQLSKSRPLKKTAEGWLYTG